MMCHVNSNKEDSDVVFANIQLQEESASDDASEGVVIEEDSNEVVVYEEEEDEDNFAGMQFVTEQIVTEQLISTKSNTVDCKSLVSLCRRSIISLQIVNHQCLYTQIVKSEDHIVCKYVLNSVFNCTNLNSVDLIRNISFELRTVFLFVRY